MTDKPRLDKYSVSKINEDTDPLADYFVLRLDDNGDHDHVLASRKAIAAYSKSIESTRPKLARFIKDHYDPKPDLTDITKYENFNKENPEIVHLPIEKAPEALKDCFGYGLWATVDKVSNIVVTKEDLSSLPPLWATHVIWRKRWSKPEWEMCKQ